MLIHLSEIMSVPGRVEQLQIPIEMEDFLLNGEKYPLIRKSVLYLVLEHIGGKKVKIMADADIALDIPCSRCLTEVETSFLIRFDRELELNDAEKEQTEKLEETSYLSGYDLDTDKLVNEEILLNFPMKVLCHTDCKGICSICGQNLNKVSCQCDRIAGDPRMAAIRDIFKNSNN